MQAAIGCAQLDKIAHFATRRRENFEILTNGLKDLEDKLILPKACENSNPSWFGYLITCKDGVDRNSVVQFLEKNGVQTRMLFAGNITKHPCFDNIRGDKNAYRVVGDLSVTDQIMENSFWIGVYPGMNEDMLNYMIEKIKEALV